jgi:hypothetical protein
MMPTERQDQLRAILENIRAKNGGRLTRKAVVAYAQKHKDGPLGRMFNWNMEEAARAHWLDRAQEIITRYVTVMVVDRSMKIRVPYYVSDPSAPTNQGGYIGLADKHTRADATVIVTNELDRVIGAVSRARDVAFALDQQHRGMSEMLQKMLQEAVDLKERLAA